MDVIHAFNKRVFGQKPVIFKVDDQFDRCLQTYDVVIWTTSAILGNEMFYFLDLEMANTKETVFAYFLSGLVYLIPTLCYWELASVQPCIGGPYHFANSLLPEIAAFSLGYVSLLSHLTSIASLNSRMGRFVDQNLFAGNLSASLRKHLRYQSESSESIFTDYPHLASLLIPFIGLGLTSSTTSTAKIINSISFMISFTVILVVTVVMIGFANPANLGPFTGKGVVHMFVACNLKTCTVFTPVILACYLGAEAVNPDKTIPLGSFLSFIFNIVAVLVIPMALNLPCDIYQLNRENILMSLMTKLNLEALMYYLVSMGLWASNLCSLYIHTTAALRLLVAMGRDKLLFSVFSRVEHNINMPVKTMFIVAFATGVMATFVKYDFLEDVSHATFMAIYLAGPYFILLLRYKTDLGHLVGKVKENPAKRWPCCNLIVTGLVLSTCAFGILLSVNTFNWFIHEAYDTLDLTTHCVVVGLVTAGFLVAVYFQPQNEILTPYGVIGCPFTPVVGIFIIAFLLPHISTFYGVAAAFWMIPGYMLYFSNSIKNSKLDVEK